MRVSIATACESHHPTVKGSIFLLPDIFSWLKEDFFTWLQCSQHKNIKLCVDGTCISILNIKIHNINFFTRQKMVCNALTWFPLTTLPVHVGVTPRRHAGIRKYRQATAKNYMRAQHGDSCQLHVRVSRCFWGFWVLTSPLVCSDISCLSCQALCVLFSLPWAFMQWCPFTIWLW